MARFTTTIGDEQATFALAPDGLSVGRALDNDIILNHATVSRHHAHVFARGRDVFVRDLDSRNGVFVNRLRVREEQLEDGAVVRIGPFELLFEDRAAQNVVLNDEQYFPLAAEAREVQSGELPDLEGNFREFYQITRRLNSILNTNDLLDAVVEEALRVVPAQRAVLLLNKGSELVPMVVHPPSQSDVALSSTIARKAMDSHQAVLTRDARLDFAGAHSIISANIRSAICAPLLTEGRAIGLIYVDSAGRDQFSEQQCDLLGAVANQAAASIERARLTEELRQQAQLRTNLERFMSPNVARLMAHYYAQHGQLWEPQELCVSVLFADVKGFTALAEALSPRETQDLLNEYFHEMTEVVFRYNGTLDKYIGDGIMAVFGAPRLNDEHDPRDAARQAVYAALDMIDAHGRLISKLDVDKTFAFRIGINTGPVYAGFFGTRQRLEYTVIGDTVNTASRLESAAELNSVLVGEETWQAVSDLFCGEEMGELQLKGKAQRVRAYRVLRRALER